MWRRLGVARIADLELELKRLRAADEVCWSLLLMMAVGALDIPMEEREWLRTTFEPWADLAVETGVLGP